MGQRSDEQIKTACRETIDAPEAATLIGVSEWKILEMARRGLIPHIRPQGCRRVLFRRSTLLAWLEAQERVSVRTDETGQYGKIRRIL